MQILSVNNINQKKIYTNFKSINSQVQKAGILKSKTAYMIQDFLHGYAEVKEFLSRKTDVGLAKIAQYYPEVTLGENLVFHNCGDDKNSISIRVAESEQNRGLVYIARRQGNTESTRKIILNSFMLDGYSRLVSNFKPNYSKSFPKEREYFSQEVIDEQNLEANLQNVLNDLEPMLLKFRKFLAKNANSDLKLPDGKINYTQLSEIKEAFRICEEIDKQVKELSNKRYLAMNNDFKDYKNISGLKSYMFQNLGEEDFSINFSEIQDKYGYNLKRLYVYDKEGSIIKLFTIIDNEKFATNLNPNSPSVLPEKYTYANTEELEKVYLPEFQKYFKLYLDKLKEYQVYVNKIVASSFKQEINGEFDVGLSSVLSEALDWYNLAKTKLRKLPNKVANSIKAKVQNMEPVVGQTGLWIKDEELKKIIQFLPMHSKQHENLIRISVTDMKTANKKDFLIHNFKHIVSNYNPKYPTIIPKFLKYSSQKEIEECGVESVFRIIKRKSEELATKADGVYEKREDLYQKQLRKEQQSVGGYERKRKHTKTVSRFDAKEFGELSKECKHLLSDALKNLDEGIENFNIVISEIKKKVNNFYLNNANP